MNNAARYFTKSPGIRPLADIAGIGWLRIDSRRTIVGVNDHVLAWLGFTRAKDLLGRKVRFNSESAPSKERECRLRDARDEEVALQFVGVASTAGYCEMLTTEPSNAEPTGLGAEQRFRQLLKVSQNGVYICSARYFLYVNEAFANMLGYRAQEIIGRPCRDFIAPADIPYVDACYAEFLERENKTDEMTMSFHMIGNTGLREVRVKVTSIEYAGRAAYVKTVQDITDLRRGEKALRDYADRLRMLSRQVLAVQEDERRNLARELHDEIGQQLTFIKLSLSQLSKRSETLERDLEEPLAGISSLMQQVRAISLDLRPSMLDDLGLTAAIRWYVGRVAKLAGLVTEIHVEAGFPRLSTDVETLFFRVAQEAVTNVMRHAGAGSLHLFLGVVDDAFELRVTDDGVGFDPVAVQGKASRGKSAGLLGMQERASLAGACLELESGIGGGTCLKLTIPTGRALGHPRQS